MEVASKAHVRTNWTAYDDCPRCGIAAGQPCTDLAGFGRTGLIFERDRPHTDREVRP